MIRTGVLAVATILTASFNAQVIAQTFVTVDPRIYAGSYNSMALVNGHPAIVYANDWHQMFIRANDPLGASWGTPVQAVPAGGYHRAVLKVVDGHPAIAFYNHLGGVLGFALAEDANGTAWGEAVIVENTGDVGPYPSLEIVSGRPAISYYDVANGDLKYARATTSTGGNASDWTQILTVDSTGVVGYHTSLAVVDGCPAISYQDGTNSDLKYARATTSTGPWGGVTCSMS